MCFFAAIQTAFFKINMKPKWLIAGGIILIFNPVSLFLIWVLCASYIENNPSIELHVSSADWLPSDATDISSFSSYNFHVYDCLIPEKSFFELAAKKDWKLEPIRESQKYFPAEYFPGTIHFRGSDPLTDEQRATLIRTVTIGYYYEVSDRNGGGIQVIYDKSNTRLYFEGRLR